MKNKYQKAHDLLNAIILVYVKDENTTKANEQLNELQELINLQEPKYVIYEPISIGGGDGHLDACIGSVAYCPNCNEEVYYDTSNDYRSEYCDSCGQRLKWR